MPYLKGERRAQLDNGVILPTTTGDLTYLFTRALLGDSREATLVEALQAAIDRYFARRQVNFVLLCDVMGALICATFEYERRLGHESEHGATLAGGLQFAQAFYDNVIAPYEDGKIEENGDVYPA